MRLPCLIAILPLLLAGRPAAAGTLSVDPVSQVVESSRLRVQFDGDYPELVRLLVFKDWSPTASLVSTEASRTEYWGQTYSGTERLGYLQPGDLLATSWQVTSQSPDTVVITITTQSNGQPEVVTRYTFFADQPYFALDRTIRFSTRPDTASYQPFVPRLSFVSDYRALRWRAADGTLAQHGYCLTPCVTRDWDGHWLQQFYRRGSISLSVATLFPLGMAVDSTLVRAYGPLTASGWAAPMVPAGAHVADATWSELVAFSIHADDTLAIDSLWTAYQGGATAGVTPAGASPGLQLSAAPNPARGGSRIAWNCPVAGRIRVEILDVSGRRVAEPFRGTLGPGSHSAAWDGRDAAGAPVAPGLYFVRLDSPAGVRCTRLARAR